MKFSKIILVALLLICLTHSAFAATDNFNFDVIQGSNTLDLGMPYDGFFVSDISGVFSFYSNSGFVQNITITATQPMDDAVVNLTVPKNANMNANYSDVRFYYSGNATELPYYINSYNSSAANISIKLNLSAGGTVVMMTFGDASAESKSNISSMFIYYLNNSSGQVFTENTTLYSGLFTNIDFKTQPTATSGSQARYWVTGQYITSAASTFIYLNGSSGSLHSLINASAIGQIFTPPGNSNGYLHQINMSVNTNSTVHLTAVRYDSEGVQDAAASINGANASRTPFQVFAVGGTGTYSLTVFDVRIYNSTTTTISFGQVSEILIPVQEIVSISTPPNVFSSLNFNSNETGNLNLNITYSTHIILLTPNGEVFDQTPLLQFQVHPSTSSTPYLISNNSNFSNVVLSGTSAGNISPNLSPGVYYWKIVAPDGEYSATRSFTVLEPVHRFSDHFVFNVTTGSNTLNLNQYYNSSYVTEISGNFLAEGSIEGKYAQNITFTAANNRDDVIINTSIQRNTNMNADFSDLRFYHSNLTSIPYYIESYNSTHANISMRVNTSAGNNSIIMSFGDPDTSSVSNLSSIFIYYLNNSSGQVFTTNTTLYVGPYTNIDLYVQPSTTATNGMVWYWFRGSEYANGTYAYNIPLIRHVQTTGSVTNLYANFTGTEQLVATPSNGAAGYSFRLNLSINPNNTARLDYVRYFNGTVNSSNTINGNAPLSVIFQLFGTGISNNGNSRIFDARIYNTTTISNISPGPVWNVVTTEIPVSIQTPSGIFSSVSYTATTNGRLSFDVFYEPHIVMLTQNGSEFQQSTSLLQFQPHPSTLSIPYQIALDTNFVSIVQSGNSLGKISPNLPVGSYYWRVMQPDGIWSETRSFTVTAVPATPGSFTFRTYNELTNAAISSTVMISNGTTQLQKSGSTITFNSSEVVAGNYSAQVNATGYVVRHFVVVSPGEYSFYLLPANASAGTVLFSLIDNSNTFQPSSTRLVIQKQTPNGTITIQSSYFDASGIVTATLNNFDSYILTVVSDSGESRILGNYIQSGQTMVQLLIGDINLIKDSSQNPFGGFTYDLIKTDNFIKLEWDNRTGALVKPLLFQIYKDGVLDFEINSSAPFGSIVYQDNVNGIQSLDKNVTYRIVMVAETENGTIRINEYYKVGGFAIGIDLQKIPLKIRIVIAFVLFVITASLFNITNSKFGAFVITAEAALFAFFGFIPILPAVVGWLLFIAIAAYATRRQDVY